MGHRYMKKHGCFSFRTASKDETKTKDVLAQCACSIKRLHMPHGAIRQQGMFGEEKLAEVAAKHAA
jgi:hypothetical protein